MTCVGCRKNGLELNNVPTVIDNEEFLELLCDDCMNYPRVKYLEQWNKAEYN